MIIKKVVRKMIMLTDKIKNWANEKDTKLIYQQHITEEPAEIHSLWDFLSFTDNTQAYHIVNVLGFDEWTDMEEIRRRIKELFGVEYKNERSLYPYLKTLVDINIVETISAGGRRKWRKKEKLFEIKKEEEKQKTKEKTKEKALSKTT